MPSDVQGLVGWVNDTLQIPSTWNYAQKQRLQNMMVTGLRRAAANGALLTAMFSECLDVSEPGSDRSPISTDSATDDTPLVELLAASAVLTTMHTSEVEGLVRFTPGFIRLGIRGQLKGSPLFPPREIELGGEHTSIETGAIIKGDKPLIGEQSLRVTHFKPLDQGNWLGVLTYETPNVGLFEDWLDVFREISSTLDISDETT